MKNFSTLFHFSRSEITRFFSRAQLKKKTGGLRLLQAQPEAPIEFGKLLIVTPRASGNACQRNRLRRRLKAIFYENQLYLHKVISAVLVYKQAQELSFEQLSSFLMKHITLSASPDQSHDKDKI
jgi:ribonuclease P protein component